MAIGSTRRVGFVSTIPRMSRGLIQMVKNGFSVTDRFPAFDWLLKEEYRLERERLRMDSRGQSDLGDP